MIRLGLPEPEAASGNVNHGHSVLQTLNSCSCDFAKFKLLLTYLACVQEKKEKKPPKKTDAPTFKLKVLAWEWEHIIHFLASSTCLWDHFWARHSTNQTIPSKKTAHTSARARAHPPHTQLCVFFLRVWFFYVTW